MSTAEHFNSALWWVLSRWLAR